MRSFVPVRSIGAVLQKEGGDRLQVVRHDECARRQSIESATNLAKRVKAKNGEGLEVLPVLYFCSGSARRRLRLDTKFSLFGVSREQA